MKAGQRCRSPSTLVLTAMAFAPKSLGEHHGSRFDAGEWNVGSCSDVGVIVSSFLHSWPHPFSR